MDKAKAVQKSINPLILIVGCARSGTSLVAGLLHYHGIWGGRYRPENIHNPKGYFENRRIIALLREWNESKRISHLTFKFRIQKILRKEKYPGGHWFVKYGLELGWNMWKKFNPFWLLVRRDWKSVKQSQENVFGRARPYSEFNAINNTMDFIRQNKDSMDIYADWLISGDYSVLSNFFKSSLGIHFDIDIANRFIDKELWHAAG